MECIDVFRSAISMVRLHFKQLIATSGRGLQSACAQTSKCEGWKYARFPVLLRIYSSRIREKEYKEYFFATYRVCYVRSLKKPMLSPIDIWLGEPRASEAGLHAPYVCLSMLVSRQDFFAFLPICDRKKVVCVCALDIWIKHTIW